MDMSLDDYMTSRPGRNSGGARGGGRLGGRLGRPGQRRLSSSPTKVTSRLGNRDTAPPSKVSALSRLGNAGAVTKRKSDQRPKFGGKSLAMDSETVAVSEPGNLKIVVTDARQKLSSKGGIQDARSKLSRKRPGVGAETEVIDARSKIRNRKTGEKTVSIGHPKTVTIGRPQMQATIDRPKTVSIGRPKLDYDDDEEENEDYLWMRTIKNPTLPQPRFVDRDGMGIQRVVNNNSAPQIVRQDKTDLTIVRNFRPSLATFSVDDNGSHDDGEEDRFNVRITRKVPPPEPVFTLPDYSDLLRDTQRKLDAGHGDMYYGKMQADQETTGTYAKVHKVTTQKTNAVEAPIITFKNDKIGMGRKSDPQGIIALPPRRKAPPPQRQASAQQEEAMDVDEAPVELVSPLQGFRITVTNLHPAVTQEDIIELFACIGPLKKARLVKKGSAEVVFVRKDDALAAVKRYHNRLLDNMPMVVKCVASAAQLKAATSTSSLTSKSKEPQPPIDLEIDVVHRALFKNASKDQGSAQPVQFLVKI